MSKSLREILKDVTGNNDLEAKFEGLKSGGEVYDFFKSLGYQGNIIDLKRDLNEVLKPHDIREIPEYDLEIVAGGLSSSQKVAGIALSALFFDASSNAVSEEQH